jgi:menaquinone-9 beta-reductase
MRQATDVIVIGGGPAGLAAAIALRAKGLQVTVVDGAQPPIDKPCGEGLLPDALASLGQLGIIVPASDGHALRGIRFVSHGSEVAAGFPSGNGFGIRRRVLHRRMIEAAEACRVELLWRTPVTGICKEGVVVAGELLPSRWTVGADGIRSRVRTWCGLVPRGNSTMRYAFRRHYQVKPWSDFMELYWGSHGQAYVTPIGTDEVCVVLVSRAEQFRSARLGDEFLGVEFPELAGRLARAIAVGSERGAVTVGQRLNKVYRQRVALVGDASGSLDAITGEGLSLRFRQATALADAISKDDLSSYQIAHRRLARTPAVTGSAMLSLDGSTWLRDRSMRGLARDPKLFERLLAVHLGEKSPARLASVGAHIFWRFAFA